MANIHLNESPLPVRIVRQAVGVGMLVTIGGALLAGPFLMLWVAVKIIRAAWGP